MTDTLKAQLAECERKCQALTAENEGWARENERLQAVSDSHAEAYARAYADYQDCQLELAQAKADLRQYEPSDGMMHKLLGFVETIREAHRLLQDVLYEKGCAAPPDVTAWLMRPIVQEAIKS